MHRAFFFLVISTFLLTACGTPIITPDEDAVTKVQNYNKVTGASDSEDAVHGKQTNFWYGAMTGMNGTNANGVAYIRRYEGGSSEVTVNLNILQAEAPSYFSAVLVNDATGARIEVGELASIIGDARHSAKLDTTEDVSEFLHVVILKHEKKGDAGTPVAEGMLKKG